MDRRGPDAVPGLRTTASLPVRAKLFVAVVGLVAVGVLIWLTIDLLRTDSLPLAILLLILSYVGFAGLVVAVLIVTRAMFSLRSVPYLLGRWIFRLVTKG